MKSEILYVISSIESLPKSSTEATKKKSSDSNEIEFYLFAFVN